MITLHQPKLLLITLWICCAAAVTAQLPSIYQVEDIAPPTRSPSIFFGGEKAEFDGKLYFQGAHASGFSLLRYDAEHLEVVIDDDQFFNSPNSFTTYQGELIFLASKGKGDQFQNSEPYSYDGQNFSLIQELNPNGGGPAFTNGPLVNYEGLLYFSAEDGTNGQELWTYDGDTMIMQEIRTGALGSIPQNFTIYDDKLYFTAIGHDTLGRELWYTDGVTTEMVADIWPGPEGSSARELTVAGGRLYFTAEDSLHGRELWTYDGTTVELVEDVIPGPTSSSPQSLVEHQDELFLGAFDSLVGFELRRVQGTDLSLVADLSTRTSTAAGSVPIVSYQDELLINVFDDSAQSVYIWRNGVIERLGEGFIQEFLHYDDLLYMSYDATSSGMELYRYDGTTLSLALDIVPGVQSSFPQAPIRYGDRMFWNSSGGTILTDGRTIAPPAIDRTGADGSIGFNSSLTNANHFILQDSLIFFTPFSRDRAPLSMLSSQGIVDAHIQLPIPDSLSMSFTSNTYFTYGGRLYFTTTARGNFRSRYLSSYGLSSGTFQVGPAVPSRPSEPTVFNGRVYFRMSTTSTGIELYEFNGTSIQLVQDLRPGSGSGVTFSKMVEYNGALFFICANDGVGFELCRFDGNTIEVVHNWVWFSGGSRRHSDEDLIVYKGKLYMPGYTTSAGEELYVYDDQNGASLAANLNGTGASGSPSDFRILNNTLYFNAFVGGAAFKPVLHKFDGTTATPVLDMNYELIKIMGIYDGRLLCNITTPETGAEPWWYDGSTFTLARDINPGCNGSLPVRSGFDVSYGGRFYFVANDGINGWELFVADATDCPQHIAVRPPTDTMGSSYKASGKIQILGTSDPMMPGDQLNVSADRSIEIQEGFAAGAGATLTVDNDGCQE
ncbi:MAG: hypothetical protein AAFQ02_00725 [Bacteroidota bacterium]